jgi:DNA methyltransferase 1-associated protein 1
MKLPPSVGQKKTKAIDQLLEELQIDQRPMGTETVCEQFNELRSDIVLLYELQQALTNCEFELQTFRHRYEPILQSKNIDMSLFDVSLSSSTSSLVNSLATGTNTPQKRISEIFEVSATPSSAPLVNISLFLIIINKRKT